MTYHCRFKEDEILDRLTGYLPVGFYIDVGAHSPHQESITKCFYDRGWNGINIEPQSHRFQELAEARPRDINLWAACGHTEGEIVLHVNEGLTTAVAEFAQNGWPTIKVGMLPLHQICETYVKDTVIDFLKIDVEGFEKAVIEGMDWEKYRPRVLCVECTIPNTTIGIFDDWDPILIANGYKFVEDNSYNRFYTKD